MKKLRAGLTKTQIIFCELVLRQNGVVEKSVADYEKTIQDVRIKSYAIRRFNF